MKEIRLTICALLFFVASAARATWLDDYDAGLKAVRAGDWNTVVTKMTSATAQMPGESDRKRTYAAVFLSYHPYYYRGIAYANLGRSAEAIADLRRASGPGEIDLGSVKTWLERLGESMPGTTAVPVPAPRSQMPSTTTTRPTTVKPPPTSSVTAVPPPPPKPVAAAAYPADTELSAFGSVAFNTPQQMTVGEQQVIQLLLDPSRTPHVLAQKITEPGRTETAVVRISKTVEAKLSGATFDIHPITPEAQPVSGRDPTEWRWEVTAREAGAHRLFLTINAVVGTDPQRRTVRTYDHTIDVRVSRATIASRYAAIAGGGLVLVALAIVVATRSRRRAFHDSQGSRVDRRPRRSTAAESAAATATTIQRRGAGAVPFERGRLVAGRYRILRFLGRGGMGEVYAAEDLELNNEVMAIKTILASSNDPQRALARLRREIQVARRVAHPNVCRVFDVGYHEADGSDRTLFVTMEYIEGRPLSEIIRERGRLDRAEALPILTGLAAGVDATHRAGLIHRDVKSANVMIAARDGRSVLMDFGLARAEREAIDGGSITETGAIVGSPMYMAPEQLQDAKLTPATDIYALGVVIYEMITGRLPFEGDSAMSVLARRLQERPTPPSRFVENLDPRWERAILKCLDPDPLHRFQSAREVVQAIEDGGEIATQVM